VTNLIGDGPVIKATHDNADVNKTLETNFANWAQRCDVEGVDDLTGLLCTAVRSIVQSGEALFHLPVDAYGNMQLRLLASEQLDQSRSVPPLGMTGDTPRIIAGVETDAGGRRVAYWVLRDSPDQVWASIEPPQRVPAEDICHVFVRKFPGQIRGISWMTAVNTTILELNATEDAAAMKAKVSALMAGFIRELDGSSGLSADATAGGGLDPATLSMEPGTLRVLPPGTDITFTPTADMSTIVELLHYMQRQIAAGAGLTYESLTGNLREVNFSSARVGAQQFQRRIKALQASMLGAQLLAPIWRRWVLLGNLERSR